MSSGWDIETDRLLRYMKVPARKKLEFLGQMHQFMVKTYSKERKKIFWKLRGIK